MTACDIDGVFKISDNRQLMYLLSRGNIGGIHFSDFTFPEFQHIVDTFRNQVRFSNCTFERINFSGFTGGVPKNGFGVYHAVFDHCTFKECTFSSERSGFLHVNFKGSKFIKNDFKGVMVFNHCDLSSTVWEDNKYYEHGCLRITDSNISSLQCNQNDYIAVSSLGKYKRTATYCLQCDIVCCGCWNAHEGGSFDEFEYRVNNRYDICSVASKHGLSPSDFAYKRHEFNREDLNALSYGLFIHLIRQLKGGSI